MDEKILRRLVIRAFHMNSLEFGEKAGLDHGKMVISKDFLKPIIDADPLVQDITVNVIQPGDYDREINTIMDILPISTKVLGKMGEGITHTLTGVYVMLTGADENGKQMAEFGSSEGNLKEQLFLNRAGTPSDKDIILHMDVKLLGDQIYDRKMPNAAFKACDIFVQHYRDILKKMDGREATESHEFFDKVRLNKPKVLIIKQIAGQGAMYDNQLFASEPSGFAGGRSIIDMGNVPMILSPNEYRDGALRSMT
jgi:D-proline reductase (dithiol) PrdD